MPGASGWQNKMGGNPGGMGSANGGAGGMGVPPPGNNGGAGSGWDQYGDVVVHHGKVGINTFTPLEALTVNGSIYHVLSLAFISLILSIHFGYWKLVQAQ